MTPSTGSKPLRSRPPRLRWFETLRFKMSVAITAVCVPLVALVWPLQSRIAQELSGPGHDRLALVLTLGTVAVCATLGAIGVARWLTGRLQRMTEDAFGAAARGELPTFQAGGRDEIAQLAESMNALSDRVDALQKSYNLRDIRRREWIAQVSHDLRTPLTAQLACLDRAEMLLDKPEGTQLRVELRELIEVAKMDGDRVHTLADDLLEIARLDAGDALTLEPVPPGELVRQAVRGLEPLAAQKGIQLDVDVTTRLPVLHADGRRLMRAIENLVRNAIQHARSSVQVLAMRSERCVRFEVRDDGKGLPKEPDFLAFLRRRSSDIRLNELARRRSRSDSAGLGLIVTQRVAEAHHGVVDAYNLSRGGAAFWIDIPIPPEGMTAQS